MADLLGAAFQLCQRRRLCVAVLHRVLRNSDADHSADSWAPNAGRREDQVGLDSPLVCLDPLDASVGDLNSGHLSVGMELGRSLSSAVVRHRLSRANCLRNAVVLNEHGAKNLVG